ncbi:MULTISPECIES: hypothetical protein [unclassified Pseudoalteromonas]|uniref:ATP-grasp domain-containing protein n=1 Tax=unclassified Pseudoalteromonas TaxID=194690 RepID=UPI0020975467|nr:hypothetical protein [Pseudoalteromonas sp. XMcav2-N]MCO7189085.1 hypothetical protein [Pseudoalteromonas sp. XMcav2-N]
MTNNSILIITNTNDVHALLFGSYLNKNGVDVDFWYCDKYPNYCNASIVFSSKETTKIKIRSNNGVEKMLSEYGLVWLRKLSRPKLHDFVHEDDLAFSESESYKHLCNFLTIASRYSNWINTFEATEFAERKLVQLEAARDIGFKLPETVVTSILQESRPLFEQHGDVIFKAYTQTSWAVDDALKYNHTARIEYQEEFAEGLAFTPSIFQNFVDKAYELRVVVFGNELVAMKIKSSSEESRVDWRGHESTLQYEHYLLDESLSAKCLALLKKLNLKFACIDIVASIDGSYTFLELNTAGNFLWMDVEFPELNVCNKLLSYILRRLGGEAHYKIDLNEFYDSEIYQNWYVSMS